MIIFALIGLGNMGKLYENTRHNIGFMLLDRLVEDGSWTKKENYLQANFALNHQHNVLLIKPTTMMNLSGQAALSLSRDRGVKSQFMIVIQDDLDLPLGKTAFRWGGTGGHNGLKSIRENMGNEYARVRMGIGRPELTTQVSGYVLGKFSNEENIIIEEQFAKIIPLMKTWLIKLCDTMERGHDVYNKQFCNISSCIFS